MKVAQDRMNAERCRENSASTVGKHDNQVRTDYSRLVACAVPKWKTYVNST